jgi:hypothetical protein
MQTTVHMITFGVMLAQLAGIAIKLKIYGGGACRAQVGGHFSLRADAS